jgi:hypothetical protein
VTFKLNDFVELVCRKFESSKDYDTPMVLIDWIEHLNSIPSVNIIKFMPRFILKFLRVIETTEQNVKGGSQQSEVNYSQLAAGAAVGMLPTPNLATSSSVDKRKLSENEGGIITTGN